MKAWSTVWKEVATALSVATSFSFFVVKYWATEHWFVLAVLIGGVLSFLVFAVAVVLDR